MTLDGTTIVPARAGADPLNVFDSSAAGWRAPAGTAGNSFGVDVVSFVPVRLGTGAHALEFTSAAVGGSLSADAFVVSTFSLEIGAS